MGESSVGAFGPLANRRPTSHERRAGQPWDASYHGGPAPWDTGRPQPAIVDLAASGAFVGTVLDAGCGTGENALMLAEQGLQVLGLDVAGSAIAIAREKASTRGVHAEFVVEDALQLARLGRSFDTVLDCGLFHTFDQEERRRYSTGLESVTDAGATLYVLSLAEADDGRSGPHPIGVGELERVFGTGRSWDLIEVAADRIETRLDPEPFPALLATIKRV